jgi:hypothetical protein
MRLLADMCIGSYCWRGWKIKCLYNKNLRLEGYLTVTMAACVLGMWHRNQKRRGGRAISRIDTKRRIMFDLIRVRGGHMIERC